jgi:hypothetical protein
MKVEGGRIGQRAFDGLQEQVDALKQEVETTRGEISKERLRDLASEAHLPPNAKNWSDVPKESRDQYERLFRERGEKVRKLEAAIEQTRRLLAPLDGLLASWKQIAAQESASTRVDLEIRNREYLLNSVDAIKRMLAAGGPDLAKQFPTAQLELIDASLREDLAELRQKLSAPPPQSTPPRTAPVATASRPTEAPKQTAVAHLNQVTDLGSAAKMIALRLGNPSLEGEIAGRGAKLEGTAKDRFTTAVQGLALLSDYATGTLDYRRIGAQFTSGGPASDRTSHQNREYGAAWSGASQARQAESRGALLDAITTAVRADDPSSAAESTLEKHLLRELGLSTAETAEWKPKTDAILKALDGEAFAPLRAMMELLPNSMSYRYSGGAMEGMRNAARRIARAVVEGRYPDSRLDEPANQAQIALLPEESQRTAWLSDFTTVGTGTRGQKLRTHEAEGFERFWATKIGGPSHGFDNFTHCVLSVIGNVRTKVIIVEDENWPQPAARAYLRLVGNEQGKPILYLEGIEHDFKLRGAPQMDRSGIAERIVAHAMARAKELGVDLVVVGSHGEGISRLQARAKSFDGRLLLEPSAVIAESSDYILGHDMPQPERVLTRPTSSYQIVLESS